MFSMVGEGSFVLPGSFHPPDLTLTAPYAATSGRRPESPAWVFLDSSAYIAERKNGTYAETTTRTGKTLGVSFWLADPPAVSHFCIHCPDIKVTDLLEEPVVLCAGKDIAVIRVAYAYGARHLESMEDLGATDLDYFVYRAHSGKPTLRRLPNPKPLFFNAREVGFLPSVDSEDFLMAVIHHRRVHLQYDLHIFSSKTNSWTTKLALLEPPSPRYKTEYLVHRTDKVITLEGGILGWVDLWRGIITCDVLASDPVLHYIEFPLPMLRNASRYQVTPAWTVRDVTCSNGYVKFIEIEERMVVPTAPSKDPRNRYTMSIAGLETENAKGTCTSESILDGWIAITWNRKTTDHWSKDWNKDCMSYVSKCSISSLLRHNHPENSGLESLAIVGPVWNMHGEDVCYLMAKAALKDKNAWAMAIDMRKNTLEGITLFSAERELFLELAYHPFALSNYLNMALEDSKDAAVAQIQETENSSNYPNSTTVLVEGLDSFITESQLKGILAMFGDLHYLEFHENERYGVAQFANRSCAEEAMRTLNGAQIGKRSIRLSWRPSILKKQVSMCLIMLSAFLLMVLCSPTLFRRMKVKVMLPLQPPQKRSSARKGNNYHPYARLCGVHSHSNTVARGNNARGAQVAAATHCNTSGSTPLRHQMWLASVDLVKEGKQQALATA